MACDLAPITRPQNQANVPADYHPRPPASRPVWEMQLEDPGACPEVSGHRRPGHRSGIERRRDIAADM